MRSSWIGAIALPTPCRASDYCGRTDDMFKVSGIWVSPFEVESALVTHEAVLEAAVVDDLKAHVKTRAGAWKYPRWIEVRADLPRTATGKIQRFKLRDE